MYGASIEQDFPHIAYEQEQLRRKFELQRLFDANQPPVQRPRRSFGAIVGQFASRLSLRSSGRRSSATQS
jgi:hypothetical protein